MQRSASGLDLLDSDQLRLNFFNLNAGYSVSPIDVKAAQSRGLG